MGSGAVPDDRRRWLAIPRAMTRTHGVAISLFSGAGGLDLGAERAGFDVRAAVEVRTATRR